MVRETRHLWVGNLPDDIREEKLKEHFARYGRVESAKLTGKRDADGSQSAFVDFVDINSATKAHDASAITIGERDCPIEYNNPDSPTEIHPGETSREYDLPGRRYDNRRGGNVEDRYDTANSNYEFDRSYGQHYSRENSQYRDEPSSSPAYRQRDRTRANNFYQHSRSSDQYENDSTNYLKENSYASENFGEVPIRKSRHKTFKALPPGQSKSPSARSGSGSGRKSKSNSRSRSRSRSKSTGSRSSDTGSERWSRSRSRDSDRDSHNSGTTQSSMGGSSKFAGLCVRNLPARSSDSSIKDGLFHEFKKYGQVTAVTVQDSGKDRKGIVFFKRVEDMEKAMEASRGNSFFGCEMNLSVWDGADIDVVNSEVKFFEKELDEFHPRATRTLYVGNLDRSVSKDELNEVFHKFGEIVHIEIKKPAGAQPFAFLQFSDIDSVVRARKKLDGEYVSKNKVKLGFGKSMATNCVWLDNLSPLVNDTFLMQFCGLRFGEVSRVVHDRRTNMALVFFINIDDSQKAVQDLKNLNVKGRRPKVDFASRECQNHFYDRMEHTGQAQYYNQSRETSPNYPERKFTKTPSGDYGRGVNFNSNTFEPRRASRSQSSSSFSKYNSGVASGNPSGPYEDRYSYPRGGEDGYHERPPYKENFPMPMRSGSYEDDDYQHALSEYSYHQKERTKEMFRERSGSASPTRHERSNSHHKSMEPVDDNITPPGSDGEDGGSPSPTPKKKWNSLAIPNSKEGTSIPRSPFSEDAEETSWKNRNGSDRGSPLDRPEHIRKKKLVVDITRDDALIEHKKMQPRVSLDKIPQDNERLKVDEIHSDLENDSSDLLQVDGGIDTVVGKLKAKRSPRHDFATDKVALKHGVDSESGVSSQHDGDIVNVDTSNKVSPREDQQRKLEARLQRFSKDNSPIDIQKIRKERHCSPGKAQSTKAVLRDSEYIPKCDSFISDSRTVEDAHSGEGNEAEPPDPGDTASCKHNDKIESFWWIPASQKPYSGEQERMGGDATGESPQGEEGEQTHAALNKPKKTETNLIIPPDRSLSGKKSSPVSSIGARLDRMPHLLSLDVDGSDQEDLGEPLRIQSTHSNQSLSANEASKLDSSFEKTHDPSSKLLSRGNRLEPDNPRGKLFDSRQRHPSIGEGTSLLSVQDGKDRIAKSADEKGKVYNQKRKEYQGTIIQEMDWKMIPLDPIIFPPSGRKEQIDAIYFKSSNSPKSLQKEDALVRDQRLKYERESEPKAAGGNLDGNDQYSSALNETPECEGIRPNADLPILSPKPGTTKTGNAASPQISVPPHLSPAGTPGKAKEDNGCELPAKAKVSLDPLFKKSSNVTLDVISSLNDSSYSRRGENKVTSWLRQMPSPTPVTLENDPRFALLGTGKVASPLLSVTPSTPVTPTTPNDGKLVDTKTIVDRLEHCRIVRKNRSSVDVDPRQDRNQNDDLIKYFQARMKENKIFGPDEARLISEQSKTGSILTKSKSEDIGVGDGIKLNRSNSDPRMTPKLTPPKDALTPPGSTDLTPENTASADPLSKLDSGDKDVENNPHVDSNLSNDLTNETEFSPSVISKEKQPLRSILKRRTESTDEIDDVNDPLTKSEMDRGLKRKRSPSPPAEGKKLFQKQDKLPTEAPDKKSDASVPTTPKFQHPTNMLFMTPNNKKKLTVKPKPKGKVEKSPAVTAPIKKPVEKSALAKKANVPKKDAVKQNSENTTVKGKAVGATKEKTGSKPSSVKKVEKKDDRKGEKPEKKCDEKKPLERKSSLERNEGKKGEKTTEDKATKKIEEKGLEKKGDEGKREEKKVDKREEKKAVKGERKPEDKRQEHPKQGDPKPDDSVKKSAKKLDEKKSVKDGRGEEKKTSEKKGQEKKSMERKTEEKKGEAKKVEDKKLEKSDDGKKVTDKKTEGSKSQERKTDEKKGGGKLSDKGEKQPDEKRAADKKTVEKKPDKNRANEEKKSIEKKVEDKKQQVEKKGDKKVATSSTPGNKKKSEKLNEKPKEVGRTSDKVVQKKAEEKNEAKSSEKSDKSRAKTTVKKLQKSESADSKSRKPAAKETMKARSKSEDKPKTSMNQQNKSSSSSGRKVTKKIEKTAGVTSTEKEDPQYATAGKGGGVRALMDWMDSDSSESEDEFEDLIFEQPSSSSRSKSTKAPPAPKKNVIFSSSSDSDSDEEMPKPPSRKPQRQVLQQLYDRVSMSDSDDDDESEKIAPTFPPAKKVMPMIHSDLTSSSDDEAPPPIKRVQPPKKKVQTKKRKMQPAKTGRKTKETPVEAKRMKTEWEFERVERESVDDSEEETRFIEENRKASAKKAEYKPPTKPRPGKAKVKENKGKENKPTKTKVEEKVDKNITTKGKAKKNDRDAGKVAQNKTTGKRKTKVAEKRDTDILSDSTEEQEKAEAPVTEPVKAQGRKNRKQNSRGKKGRAKPSREIITEEEMSEDPKVSESEIQDRDDDVEKEEEVAPPSLDNVSLNEPELEVPLEIPHGHVQHEEVVEESQVEELIVQDYETEEIVTEKPLDEPVPAPVEVATPLAKPTTKTPKRRKGKHRHNKRMKKEAPPVEPATIPEVNSDVETAKQELNIEEDKTTEDKEKPAERPEEIKHEVPPPGVEEEPTPKLLGECMDAEKEAAMFEETAEATAALVFEETAEATAALEMVEREQERQRVLEEDIKDIFGESSPAPRSPNMPSMPSPSAPLLQPLTPRPVTPEVPPEPQEVQKTEEKVEIKPCDIEEEEAIVKQEDEAVLVKSEQLPPVMPGGKQRDFDVAEIKVEKLDESSIKAESTTELSPIKTEIPTVEEAFKVETKATDNVVKQEENSSNVREEEKMEIIPTVEPLKEETENGPFVKEAPEVKVPVSLDGGALPEGTAHANDLPEHTAVLTPGDVKSDMKLEHTPVKLPDSSLELKSDVEGAEETASVEVTTETASEANESHGPDLPPDPPIPSEAVREKLPEPPQTPHKSKKKKEHKKKKHKDKKSSKKDGSRNRDKKQRREKKQKRHKSSKEERRKRRQRKAERHRSVSGSSFSDVHGGMDHKSLESLQGQATAASMEPISHPHGAPIQKIENQQAYPFGQGLGLFQPNLYGSMDHFMKPPMINPHLGPSEGNMSPMQTISPSGIQQPLRIIGVGPKEDVKLIDPYFYQGMQANNPGHFSGLLSPKARHPSGKEVTECLPQVPETTVAAVEREKPEVELVADGNLNQNQDQLTKDTKDIAPSGDQSQLNTSEASLTTEEKPGRNKGDVYEFDEEETSNSTPGGQENQQKSTKDPYEFQESPGPASSKVSPSRVASRGRLRPRPNRVARTRSNSRGAAKDARPKEESAEVIGIEGSQTAEPETVTPKSEAGPIDIEPKAVVAELVPSSTDTTVATSKTEVAAPPAMPLSLPNTGALAGMIPMDALPPHTDKQQMGGYTTDHIRMIANVATATTSMASMLQNKSSSGGPVLQSQSAMVEQRPPVSMPAVVAALNNPTGATAKMQLPGPPIPEMRHPIPTQQPGPKKRASKKRSNDKQQPPQVMNPMPYQIQFSHPSPQAMRNINSTQNSLEAVEMHFSESLRRQPLQHMAPKMQVPGPGQPPMGVIVSQPPMSGPPVGTTSGSASREAPAITSHLIGAQSFVGNRSPAMAVGMKSGPHTIASVPGSQTSPDTSIPGVSRSGMHPNLPSTLVAGPTAKRQPGVMNKYECRVPTSVAAATYPDASVLRARLTQNDPKMRGEDGKMLPNQPPPAEGHGPGPFLHPSGYVEKVPMHGEEKDHHKPGERIPAEQRLASAYESPIVFLGPRPGDLQGLRGPAGQFLPGMFPEPAGPGIQGLPGLVHPPYGMPGFPGPFPPRMFHPMVHAEQSQPLASPRAMASPRMVVPNTSSPRLSPKIKSPGLGHGDRTAQTPDKQAELHNVALRHPPAPGITTGIPPPGKDHPHRGIHPSMMPKGDQDKASEDRRQMNHLPPHGLPPHIQQLPAQSIPDHARTTPIPHPERGSPGSRTPGPDGRTQIATNAAAMKPWPPTGMTPHTTMPGMGAAPAATMGDDASVMLLMRYPVMWQGMLALKQEIATIQLHFICGNKIVATDALKMAYPPLRIAQRMRLEDSQLEGVARRMQVAEESVVLLALPCGSDQDEVMSQTSAMRSGLISYLRDKQAAGIINVGPPGCTDPSFVIHIFPPCEFTQRSLSHKAPDLLESVMNLAYMMFVIATC